MSAALLRAAQPEKPKKIVYPDSDGEPMAENSVQAEWMALLHGNLLTLYPNDWVAMDHFWYPVEGRPDIRQAPDVYVALGRPRHHRGSYLQWEEEGVAPQVVFEVWSPGNSFAHMLTKHRWYERYGVQEFYTWDPDRKSFAAFIRSGDSLEPVHVEDGWTSPLLGIRLVMEDGELRVYGRDGARFLSFEEVSAVSKRAQEEAQRAHEEAQRAHEEAQRAQKAHAALLEKLRAAGIDPDSL